MALPLFADIDLGKRVSLLECKMNCARNESVYDCRPGARFANGRPAINGYGVWVQGQVLYWTAFEGGSDFAYSSFSPTAADEVGTVYKPKFEWDAGYRLGAGYSWTQDNWDIALLFTRIKPHSDTSINSPPPGARLAALLTTVDNTSATQAEVDWELKLSTLDFELGREYFISHYLYLRPQFGLRAAWIEQYPDVLYNETVKNRNTFQGAGLRLGAETKWFFDRHWNVSLLASASTLYGRAKVRNFRDIPGFFTTDQAMTDWRIFPTAQIALGLGWELPFACNRNHLSLNAAYELNYWWRQNQMVFFETGVSTPFGTRYSDDLGFHGLTFDIALSF
jgi:hypothetical protein